MAQVPGFTPAPETSKKRAVPGFTPAPEGTSAPQPPAGLVTPPAEQAAAQTRNTPLETAVSPIGWARSVGRSAKKNTYDVWTAAQQRDRELGGTGKGLMGLPEVLMDSFVAGEHQAQERAAAGGPLGVLKNFPENVPLIGPPTHAISETMKRDPVEGLTDIAAMYAVPEAAKFGGEFIEAPVETLRETGRRMASAGPEAIDRAAMDVEGRAGKVARSNAKATGAAESRNVEDVAQANREHQAALDKHAKETAEGQAKYDADLAAHEAELAQAKETNAQAQTEVAKRGVVDRQANEHAGSIVEDLPQAAKGIKEETRALYPKIRGQVEDPASIADEAESLSNAAMRQSGPTPKGIQRIINAYKPVEEAGGDLGEGHIEGYPLSEKMAAQLKDVGGDVPGEPKTEATFDNLHSQYSALGREMSRGTLSGYELKAYQNVRAMLLDHMKDLAEAEGGDALEQFKNAQKEWERMEKTFYAPGSPVAKALAKIEEINSSLRDNPAGARAAAAPYVRQILAETKNYGYAKELLKQFGQSTDTLDALKQAHDEAGALPKKAKLVKEPTPPRPFVPKPAPTAEPPVPAHVADLKAPPEPFNAPNFIRSQAQRTAENLQKFRGPGWLARYPAGRAFGNKSVQNFLANDYPEPPQPFRAQPGAPGAQGGATPFEQPPPSTHPVTPRSEMDASIEASTRAMGLRDQIRALGNNMPVERAKLVAELQKAENDARKIEGGPPAGTPERRGASPSVEAKLEQAGIKVDPSLLKKWRGVISDVMGKIRKPLTPEQVRSVKSVLSSSQMSAQDVGDRLRSIFGIKGD